MSEVLNYLAITVAIGIGFLFATFFIILGLHKREIWEEFKKHIAFK